MGPVEKMKALFHLLAIYIWFQACLDT